MKFLKLIGIVGGLACLGMGFAQAEESVSALNPWEKFSASAGVFLTDTNSSVRVGSGVGVDLDMEKLLGMDSKSSVFRTDASWRFSANRRHRVDASWFAFHRSANKQVGEDFDVTDSDGNITTVPAGTQVSSHFNLDIIEAAYSYSFFQDDRVDLAAVFGLYVMPINFGLQANSGGQVDTSFKFNAPLPVAGFRMDFALTPKWFIRSGSQFFYVQYQGFTGKVMQTRGAVEYLPFQHVGFGLGVDTMRIDLEAGGKDYPNIDLKGNIQYQYTGLQLYGKYFF